jgi:glycerophosphoryl diester phosphodiesterase
MTRSRPLLLGHRGARATTSVPENTLASFDLCLQHGCDGFEFDVRRTASGVPVVCHDETFRGLRLSRASAQDLVPWQAQGFLPTLEQVLERFAQRCFLDIELKEPSLESQILDLLQRYPAARGCVVSSFLPDVLLRLRDLDSTVELGYLFDKDSEENSTLRRSLPVQWVLPERRLFNDALASNLLAEGKRVGVWTVNYPADMLRLAARGAEMLISDDTARLVNTFPVI